MTNKNTQTKAGKKPDFIAYAVDKFGKGQKAKSFWTRVGAAWTHQDGNGINIQLGALPLDGEIVLRIPNE